MGTLQSRVRDVLFGQTRARILGLTIGHPHRRFYFQELRREIGAPGIGSVQRELQTLAEAGILRRSEEGNQVYYQANDRHPLFPELRGLIAKTIGVFEVLSSALLPLQDRIRVAFVYGSIARGEETAESDVDLFIIGPVTFEELLEKFTTAEKRLARLINPSVYSESDYRDRVATGSHFLAAVTRGEKVFLIGDEDELERMAGRATHQG